MSSTAQEKRPLLNDQGLPAKGTDITCSERPSRFSDELRGYMYMLASSFGYSGMTLCVRVATSTYAFPVLTTAFIRGMVQVTLALVSLFLFSNGREAFQGLSLRQWGLLGLRGAFGGVSLVLCFLALSLLPLGVETSLYFTSTLHIALVWHIAYRNEYRTKTHVKISQSDVLKSIACFFCLSVLLFALHYTDPILTMTLSALILGEAVGFFEIAAASLSFVGVFLISNPSLRLGLGGEPPSHALGIVSSLLSALFGSCAYVTIRSLGRNTHFLFNVASLGVSSVFVSTLCGGGSLQKIMANHQGTLVALLSALFGFCGQCLLCRGLQYCRAGTGAIMRNIDVPVCWILGVVFLNEVPNICSLLGSACILTGTLMVGVRQIWN